MTIIRVSQFGGIIPKRSDDELPENAATECINFDLTKRGLVPVYDISFKHEGFESSPRPTAACSVQQLPTACLKVTGTNGTYVEYAPIGGNHVVVANDELVYAVLLPEGTTTEAGQGAIDLTFTAGGPLGNINDQNAVGSLTGDITSMAKGKWYVRVISLATRVGGTINGCRFYNNHATASAARTSYFGFALIRNTGTPRFPKLLWDVEQQAAYTAITAAVVAQTEIDEDETVFVNSGYQNADLDSINFTVSVPAQFSGPPRNKIIYVGVLGQYTYTSIGGLLNFQIISGWDISTPSASVLGKRSFIRSLYGNWIGLAKPTAAMGLSVAGGTGPTVTRSYVYTRVSEDGLESGPSPAVTVSGNRDGTWQLTSITSWAGTSEYNAARSAPKKRIYRTPENSATYKFVAEISATTTSANDTAADSVLGETLATSAYLDPPNLTGIATYGKGMLAGVVEETTIAFCEPYKYHAWPLAYRYTINYVAVAIKTMGDRVVVLTKDKPVVFSGSSPSSLVPSELDQGEACIDGKAAVQSPAGVIYPGTTGWGLINYGGYQKVTADFLDESDYADIVGKDTLAAFDGRKLIWFDRGATTGYSFEFGANERSLTKFETTYPLYAISFFEPRNARWVAYLDTSIKVGKLFANTSQRLKGTWKSALRRTPKPVRFKVAQIRSMEWDTLSASMKAREAAYKTGGGGSPYTITITGLTQAEPWCYLKVWCEADKGADKVLVFDDFVVSDRPVRLARAMKSDCWQFEVRGNIHVGGVVLAELEKELNQE